MSPYHNVENTTKVLTDYSYWFLKCKQDHLYKKITRIDLIDLYLTIYINLFELGIINTQNEPHISKHIQQIIHYKLNKNILTQDELQKLRYLLNSFYLKGLNNKYLLHQVLNNLYSPITTNSNLLYIDTDTIYLTCPDKTIIDHLQGVYGKFPAQLTITQLDYLLIKKHKIVAESQNGTTKTSLDKFIVGRKPDAKSKIDSTNTELKGDFNTLIREDKLQQLLSI